jgi:hypothetical protein
MGRRVPLPAHVRASLEELFGRAVDDVEIIEHSWFATLHGRALATTRPGRIYLRGTATDFFASPTMVLHEYFHVLEQWRTRRLTIARYLLEWLRRGYWDNRFEIEAREFAEDRAHRFRARLAHHQARERLVRHS